MKDTTTVNFLDSSTIIKSENEHIILIQDLKKEPSKVWYESPWITSLLIPILVAATIAWLTNKLNRRKNKLEIDKLKEETSNLKRSFQPIVIGTLQSIQDKIIASKIEALKSLVQIRNRFTHYEQQYCEGDPITPDYDMYLDLLFYNFTSLKYDDYSKFHENYSYLFPDKVFNVLLNLYEKLSGLNEDKKSFNSIGDPDSVPGHKDYQNIEQIIELFKEAILEIRKDCHLDTSFIHDFIEENKK
jgi:hypothetical protein